jgi:hypothetical protein
LALSPNAPGTRLTSTTLERRATLTPWKTQRKVAVTIRKVWLRLRMKGRSPKEIRGLVSMLISIVLVKEVANLAAPTMLQENPIARAVQRTVSKTMAKKASVKAVTLILSTEKVSKDTKQTNSSLVREAEKMLISTTLEKVKRVVTAGNMWISMKIQEKVPVKVANLVSPKWT